MQTLPFKKLDSLAEEILRGLVGSSQPWQGADVFVLSPEAEYSNPKGSFYPDDRLLRTKHFREVSWFFEKLRDLMIKVDGYGFWKEEFFGRITNIANDFTKRHSQTTAIELLEAILHEVYAILEEMNDGEFQVLSLTIGNRIAHDRIKQAETDGFLTIEETRAFFAARGILS